MSRHTLSFDFTFTPEDRSDPQSCNHCDIGDVRLDDHIVNARISGDWQVQTGLRQAVMRMYNLQAARK